MDAQSELVRLGSMIRELEQTVAGIRSSRFTEEDGFELERRVRAIELDLSNSQP